jgi:hypothetical protein
VGHTLGADHRAALVALEGPGDAEIDHDDVTAIVT